MKEERRLVQRPRCDHCGEIIGVYEPAVVRSGPSIRETSLAAEPELGVLGVFDTSLLHRACFELLEVEGQAG